MMILLDKVSVLSIAFNLFSLEITIIYPYFMFLESNNILSLCLFVNKSIYIVDAPTDSDKIYFAKVNPKQVKIKRLTQGYQIHMLDHKLPQ